jgi:hypothetical protein
MFKRIIPFVAIAFAVAACDGEATPTDTTDPTDEPTPVEDPAIVGDWVSTGADVAPLLAGFGITSIDATFEANGNYTVVTDASGTMTTLTGTYTVDESTVPHTIALSQTSPTNVTSEGIWQVDADGSMRYEVVDVSLGTPPTPTGGFGVDATLGDTNVQVFQPVSGS